MEKLQKMLTTKYLFCTLRENPINTQTISHYFMLKSGMIRKISSGLYAWMPTGYKILKKITHLIRKEMNHINALEMYLPLIQPKNIWCTSGRDILYGKELINIINRRNKKFILSPTYEEMITNIMKNEINSYKKLPIILYQIQKKFRDEKRSRFGILRTTEFIMKDAYSFHISKKSLEKTYQIMCDTYIKIFKKLKLIFKIIPVESKIMGGSISHEFHALSATGEDQILYEKNSYNAIKYKYITNKKTKKEKKKKKINIFFIKVNSNQKKYKYTILLTKKKNDLHHKSLKSVNILNDPITLIHKIDKKNNLNYLFKKKNIFFIINENIKNFPYFIINKKTQKFTSIIWNQNIIFNKVLNFQKENTYIFKKNNLEKNKKISKSIEIGHIFQLNQKYSKIMNATIIDHLGSKKFFHMGCYGIGINRIISAIIEQNHDNKGIIWPVKLAPFQVYIIPINMHQSNIIEKHTKDIYFLLKKEKISVLLDDRKENPGTMFTDMELIGIPHGIIVGKNNVKNNQVEYYSRKKNKKKKIPIYLIIKYIKNILNK